jgi:hypothetical protein
MMKSCGSMPTMLANVPRGTFEERRTAGVTLALV